MNAPDEGAGQLYPVAGSDLEVLVDAEQSHANHREHRAQPGPGTGFLANQQP